MPTIEPTLEEILVDHIAGTHFDDLDAQTINCCKKLIVDTLGVTFSGQPGAGMP